MQLAGQALRWTARKSLLLSVIGATALLPFTGQGLGQIADGIAYQNAVQEARTRIRAFVDFKNPRRPEHEKALLVETILRQSERLRVPDHFQVDGRTVHPAYFLTALIAVESTFDREAVSHADARGYMQLMPQTVAWMDENLLRDTETEVADLFQTATNLSRGVTYLNFLIEEMGDLRLVCLAYNAGPGAVSRGFWVERYWQKIHAHYREIEAGAFQVRAIEIALAY